MSKFDEMVEGLQKEVKIPEPVWERYMLALENLPEKNAVGNEATATAKRKGGRLGAYLKRTVAAVVAFALIGTTAYAAERYFGVADFFQNSNRELSIEAADIIDKDITQEVVNLTEQTVASYTVKEAMCDAERIYIVMEASACDDGSYLFVPEDALLEEQVLNFGIDSPLSVGDYAASKQLKVVRIGASIVNTEALGIHASAIHFQSVSDDVMDIMIECGTGGTGKTLDVICAGTALMEGKVELKDVMRSEIRFTLTDISQCEKLCYVPQGSADLSGLQAALTKVDVVQTTLGTYLEIHYQDMEADEDTGLCFRLAEEGVTLRSGESGTTNGQNEAVCKLSCDKIALGDTIQIEAYNCWDGTVYGVFELVKE